MPEKSLEDMDKVAFGLVEAEKYGLDIEVVLWALYHARENPNATIEECMDAGLGEWIK